MRIGLAVAWLIVGVAGCGRDGEGTSPPHVAAVPVEPVVAVAPSVADADPTPSGDLGAWERLGRPRVGDWRDAYPDDVASDFATYVASDPVRADDARRVLAFLPVGPFRPEEKEAFDAAVGFCALWFDLPVRTLDPVPLTEEPEQSRMRAAPDGVARRQYRTTWFLNGLLPDLVPQDAVVLLGVTTADLFPNAQWNFVFGQANLRRRIGVYSLARYFPPGWTGRLEDGARRLALLRTLKVVTHEAGHTLGLEHCTTWLCTMNGSNSLEETDRGPLLLCPECLRKLAWNRGFDIRERYAKLAEFLERHGFAEEAAWHRARAERLR